MAWLIKAGLSFLNYNLAFAVEYYRAISIYPKRSYSKKWTSSSVETCNVQRTGRNIQEHQDGLGGKEPISFRRKTPTWNCMRLWQSCRRGIPTDYQHRFLQRKCCWSRKFVSQTKRWNTSCSSQKPELVKFKNNLFSLWAYRCQQKHKKTLRWHRFMWRQNVSISTCRCMHIRGLESIKWFPIAYILKAFMLEHQMCPK